VPSAPSSYDDPRAHALRERYVRTFGGAEIPVPVESIAEDLLGLRIEERLLEWSGMLLPAERTIVLNLAESPRNDPPLRRQRFTIAHEIGHWVCHCLEGRAAKLESSYCRATDIAHDADRALEREANIFAAELLMPEAAVRAVWGEIVAQSHEDPVAAVAQRFDVSPTAMGWRLYSAGLRKRPPSAPDLARGEAESGGPYDGVSAPTLRAWLAYWKGVQEGSVRRSDVDAGIDEGHEVSRLTAELETRTHPRQ